MSEVTPPSAKRRRLDFAESIRLLIGPAKHEVLVPKAILTKRSEFFKVCCDGHDWKEKQTNTVVLPEDDVDTFSAYLQLLFTGELVVADEALTPDMRNRELSERHKLSKPHFDALRQLAILGDKLGDAFLSNAVVDGILKVADNLLTCPGEQEIHDLYPHLPLSSPTRRLLQELYASSTFKAMSDSDWAWLPSEFVRDIMTMLLKEQGEAKKPPPEYKDRCKYHIHNDKVPKCK